MWNMYRYILAPWSHYSFGKGEWQCSLKNVVEKWSIITESWLPSPKRKRGMGVMTLLDDQFTIEIMWFVW